MSGVQNVSERKDENKNQGKVISVNGQGVITVLENEKRPRLVAGYLAVKSLRY